MKKLPEQFKKDWVAALRSGEYKQVKEHLEDNIYNPDTGDATDVGYCCLGVAACILNLPIRIALDAELTALDDVPQPIIAVMNQPIADDSCVENHLVKMNDNYGKSFDEIATWIEENL